MIPADAGDSAAPPQMTERAQQKERTRERILDSAARVLRTSGIGGASVAEVMKGAGLTVGGFYAHFTSKGDLIQETMRVALAEQRDQLFASVARAASTERIDRLLKAYLSRTHRDTPETGCPLPAIVAEIAHADPAERDVFVRELDVHLRAIEEMTPKIEPMSTRTLSLGLLALLYGGLSLARATRGTPISDEVLRASRAFARAACGIAQSKNK